MSPPAPRPQPPRPPPTSHHKRIKTASVVVVVVVVVAIVLGSIVVPNIVTTMQMRLDVGGSVDAATAAAAAPPPRAPTNEATLINYSRSIWPGAVFYAPLFVAPSPNTQCMARVAMAHIKPAIVRFGGGTVGNDYSYDRIMYGVRFVPDTALVSDVPIYNTLVARGRTATPVTRNTGSDDDARMPDTAMHHALAGAWRRYDGGDGDGGGDDDDSSLSWWNVGSATSEYVSNSVRASLDTLWTFVSGVEATPDAVTVLVERPRCTRASTVHVRRAAQSGTVTWIDHRYEGVHAMYLEGQAAVELQFALQIYTDLVDWCSPCIV